MRNVALAITDTSHMIATLAQYLPSSAPPRATPVGHTLIATIKLIAFVSSAPCAIIRSECLRRRQQCGKIASVADNTGSVRRSAQPETR